MTLKMFITTIGFSIMQLSSNSIMAQSVDVIMKEQYRPQIHFSPKILMGLSIIKVYIICFFSTIRKVQPGARCIGGMPPAEI